MVQVNNPHGTNIVVGQRYQLLRQIGQQKPTELWEASDLRLERTVALRLLSAQSREDGVAQATLRQAMRQSLLEYGVEVLRVLDGGEDPRYGPFVVAELSDVSQATQPLATLDSPPSSRPSQPTVGFEPDPSMRPESIGSPSAAPAGLGVPRRRSPSVPAHDRRGFGVFALAVLLLLVLAALGFLVRSFAPPQSSTGASPGVATLEQRTRPLSGAPAARTAPTATIAPTLAAPEQASAPRPSQATIQATSGPTRLPTAQAAAPAPTVAGSPVDTIRQHYALIDAKRYADGYALMDAHLRSLNSPADYAGWFANKVSIKPISVDVVSETDSQSVVRSVVSTTDHLNGQDITTQVSEQFILHKEEGAWRIDQVSRI